ncbi:MAG: 50S ribosomal protein L24e [Candidatus Bathyarchaeia archaeon]|nr:50S ribosomal protein L24e [Candidatus Bathyarchaeia archaeon]
MPRTYTCSFCGKGFPQATGMMFIKNDGSILYFCSSKCRKSLMVYRRDPRKLKWTLYYGKKERGK